MNKTDLKKLALMGIAGGILFSAQSQASGDTSLNIQVDNLIAKHGCGGKGGCGGRRARPTTFPKPQTQAYNTNNIGRNYYTGANMMEPGEGDLTEEELIQQLNQEGRNLYNSLNNDGKALALQLANQTCAGHNDCKGLNSCSGDENSCAGEGGCKGQSKCSFHDKNLAVQVAAKHMEEQRGNVNQNQGKKRFRFFR